MVMFRHEIEKKLSGICLKRFSIDFLHKPELKKMRFLSKADIPARELLHVYFDVKNTFGISIPEKDIVEGRFDTFEHIVDIIIEQLSSHTANVAAKCQ